MEPSLPTEQLQKLWRTFDEDGNGGVDRDEFVRGLARKASTITQDPAAACAPPIPNATKVTEQPVAEIGTTLPRAPEAQMAPLETPTSGSCKSLENTQVSLSSSSFAQPEESGAFGRYPELAQAPQETLDASAFGKCFLPADSSLTITQDPAAASAPPIPNVTKVTEQPVAEIETTPPRAPEAQMAPLETPTSGPRQSLENTQVSLSSSSFAQPEESGAFGRYPELAQAPQETPDASASGKCFPPADSSLTITQDPVAACDPRAKSKV